MPKQEKGEEAEEVPQKGVRERRGDVRDRLLGSPQMLVALFIFVCVAEAGILGQSGLFRSPRYAFRITPACGKRLPLITFRIPGSTGAHFV